MSQCLHFTSIQLAELFSESTSILEQTRHKADRNIRNKNIYKTKTYQEWNGQIRELISVRNTSQEHNSKDPSLLVFLLCSLQWLPVDSRIQYKLASLCCNGLNSPALGYLTELKSYKPYLPDTYTLLLILPFFFFFVSPHSFGQMSFAYAASSVWKSFPFIVKRSNTVASFQSCLTS